MGLGRWLWIYVGGGGKLTRMIVAYQQCSLKIRRTMGETVWDQHLRYFESRGESQDPRSMFYHDLISHLRQWKGAGDEIMLLGDFNKKIYWALLLVPYPRKSYEWVKPASGQLGRCCLPLIPKGAIPSMQCSVLQV